MELYQAHRQWAERPADERFRSLPEMHAATLGYRGTAAEATAPYSSLRVEAREQDLVLVGNANVPARLTHWAMGQMSARAGAPAGYLRQLPATLAAQNLNHGLKQLGEGAGSAQLLFHKNGDLVVRAATSERYSRIWNHEVIERLLPLLESGWTLPPVGMDIGQGPAHGLYASDHDMFAFLIRDDRRIADGSGGGLARGVFVVNSEVGAAALKVKTFLYRFICGNHIVWSAEQVQALAIRHVGAADQRFGRQLVGELRRYADSSASDLEAKIESARRFELGPDKDKVLDAVFGRMRGELSRKQLAASYEEVRRHPEDGSPRTAWGLAQGVTRLSQAEPYADTRAKMDRAAGKIVQMAF